MTQRLDFFDAARGLAIFTVVYAHICGFCLPYHEYSFIADLLRMYFINAFFFISGFFAVKVLVNLSEFTKALWKRCWQILIPSVVMGLIYVLSHGSSVTIFLFDPAKYGYWFTFSLFDMFAVYYTFSYIAGKLTNQKIGGVLFLGFCLILYLLNKRYHPNCGIYNILCLKNAAYSIPLFALGVVTNLYKSIIIKILKIGRGCLVLIPFIITGLSYWYQIPQMINRIAVVILMIWVIKSVYHNGLSNSADKYIKKMLQFFGKNTLEIYFIHYFLLFKLPEGLAVYFHTLAKSSRSLSMPEFMIIGSLAIIISFSSIFIAYLLKQIPYVSIFAFGKRQKLKKVNLSLS